MAESFGASATFTPAAASHTNGDVNGGAQEFAFTDELGLVPSPGARVAIVSASLMIAGGTAEATGWDLYLYSITPPSAVADDAAHTLASGDRAYFLGKIDLGTAVDEGATQYIETNSINKIIRLSGSSVFGYLVNDTTVTPANVAHTVKLEVVEV